MWIFRLRLNITILTFGINEDICVRVSIIIEWNNDRASIVRTVKLLSCLGFNCASCFVYLYFFVAWQSLWTPWKFAEIWEPSEVCVWPLKAVPAHTAVTCICLIPFCFKETGTLCLHTVLFISAWHWNSLLNTNAFCMDLLAENNGICLLERLGISMNAILVHWIM